MVAAPFHDLGALRVSQFSASALLPGLGPLTRDKPGDTRPNCIRKQQSVRLKDDRRNCDDAG